MSSVQRTIAAADAGKLDLTPDTLRAAGHALYGPLEDWITVLAHDLNVSRRTVERWLNGKIPIPAHIAVELGILCADYRLQYQQAADRIDRFSGHLK